MASVSLGGIEKSYGDVAVIHGVDIEIADGEFVALVGPSGCGKSTLLRLIAGLEPITAGEMRIDGERVNEKGAAERGLAMVFQSYALYPHMSVRKNISFGLENQRLPREEIARRVARAASTLRLEDYLERKPRALSGGQRQRVAIGRAIVRDPKVLLFDEPLSNLDAELRVATRREIAALHAEIGGTMIYVTHDQVEAMTLADRIVVLRAGRVEQAGAPLELYNRPANLFVAGFIGSPKMNLLPAKAVAANAAATSLALGGDVLRDLPLAAPGIAAGADVVVGVRPEHVRIVAPGRGDFDGSIAFSERLGAGGFAYVDVEGAPQVTVQEDGQAIRPRGARVGLALAREGLHLFDPAGPALARSAAGA
ncbi:MAG: sn-glycerol-3-phosphate ABC transporter ATP-binding protein UgpC [Hyphomicrobiales bacterium]|nr:sn-glycerol-3-phosphate ABC transporter ATP-binding protein UgpC [Hyphomicrobiales bacterium]